MTDLRQAEWVNDFWFHQIDQSAWWTASVHFDSQVRAHFLHVHALAARGEFFAWRATPQGRLAEIIVLDQFSRNMFRGTREAFAFDPVALVLAQEAVAAGAHLQLEQAQRAFLLMPYMHSESNVIHVEAEQLFREHAAANLEYELKHKAIIDRFGRYPHRNQVLGRESTPEETEFLKQPGSSF